MKHLYKIAISMIISLGILCICILPSGVVAQASTVQFSVAITDFHYEDYARSADKSTLDEFAKVLPFFQLENGQLTLSKDIKDLEKELSLSKDTVAKVQQVLNQDYSKKIPERQNGVLKPMVHVSDWKVYFTADDVVNLLFSASQLGPAAMTAALSATMSVFPGLGTAAGAIIGYLGGAYICYTVFQAVARHQGLYFCITWNGPFPNPVFGYW